MHANINTFLADVQKIWPNHYYIKDNEKLTFKLVYGHMYVVIQNCKINHCLLIIKKVVNSTVAQCTM